MNAKRVNAAEGVILAALKTKQTAAGVAIALESACLLQSPEIADELADLRIQVPSLRTSIHAMVGERYGLMCEIDRLREERHSTNEALSKAVERLAELEAVAAKVAQFCAQRAEYVDNLRNCNPDNGHDYDRWQGHAAARRQLSQLLGLPVGWPAEDTVKPHPTEGELAEQRHLMDPLDHALEALAPRSAVFAARAVAESDPGRRAAWRMLASRQAEDSHDSPLHHDYALGRDLPSPWGDPIAYGPTGVRCGCGKDAHSNLTPCQPDAGSAL